MVKPEDEGRLVAVRLSHDEMRILDDLVDLEIVRNVSEGIRLAIRLVRTGMATQILTDVDSLQRQAEAIAKGLAAIDETEPNWWGGMDLERLKVIAEEHGPVGELAARELFRRGWENDSIGHWSKRAKPTRAR